MIKKLIAISLLLIYCQTIQAVQIADDFTAVYSLEKFGARIAEMTLSLSQKNNKVTYKSHTVTSGMLAMFNKDRVKEVSHLILDKQSNHIALQDYKFLRKNKTKKNQQFSLTRDELNNISIQGSYSGKVFNLTTSDIVWDRLSVQLALINDLKSDKGNHKKYSYKIIDKSRIITYHFEFMQNEELKVKDVLYNTIKIKRPHDSGKRTTYLWLSKDLNYLPVKVEQYRKGKLHMSMFLNTFTQQK